MSRGRTFRFCIAFFFAAAAMGAAVGADSGCIGVSGGQIRAQDLAAGFPVFASLPGDTILALAPAPGVKRFFNARALDGLAARHGLLLAPSLLSPSPPTHREPAPLPNTGLCVERISRSLQASEVRAAVEGAIRQALPHDAVVEIDLVEFSRYPIPPGSIEFSVSGLAAAGTIRPEQAVLWKGCVREEGSRHSVPVWARVRLVAVRRALEAGGPLIPGKPVTSSQVRLVTRRMFAFAKPPLTDPAEAEGKIPRRLIRSGEILQPGDLSVRREVEAGDAVSISVAAGALQLTLAGKAESGGALGDGVLVRSNQTGRRLRGMVEARARVRIETQEQEKESRP